MPETNHDLKQHGSCPDSATIQNIGHTTNSRGESLAARIEEGAARLAAFA